MSPSGMDELIRPGVLHGEGLSGTTARQQLQNFFPNILRKKKGRRGKGEKKKEIFFQHTESGPAIYFFLAKSESPF